MWPLVLEANVGKSIDPSSLDTQNGGSYPQNVHAGISFGENAYL
jgi:hypothetical protein